MENERKEKEKRQEKKYTVCMCYVCHGTHLHVMGVETLVSFLLFSFFCVNENRKKEMFYIQALERRRRARTHFKCHSFWRIHFYVYCTHTYTHTYVLTYILYYLTFFALFRSPFSIGVEKLMHINCMCRGKLAMLYERVRTEKHNGSLLLKQLSFLGFFSQAEFFWWTMR